MLGLDIQRQNTGAGVNPSGKVVRFGTPGNADLTGQLRDGRKLDVEVKREGFDPSRLRGEKAAHFARQLARLQKTNAGGGVGFWTDDADEFIAIIQACNDGASVIESGTKIQIVYPNKGTRKA
jgi:hypothetical protein